MVYTRNKEVATHFDFELPAASKRPAAAETSWHAARRAERNPGSRKIDIP